MIVEGLLTHRGMSKIHNKSTTKYITVHPKNTSNHCPVHASASVCFFFKWNITSQFQFMTFKTTIGIRTIKLKKSWLSRCQSSSCLGTPGRTTFLSGSTRKWCSMSGVRNLGGADRVRLRRSERLRDWNGLLNPVGFCCLGAGDSNAFGPGIISIVADRLDMWWMEYNRSSFLWNGRQKRRLSKVAVGYVATGRPKTSAKILKIRCQRI